MPADLDAAKEIGLGARHTMQAGRDEHIALAENLFVGVEGNLCAAPVLNAALVDELRQRRAARIALRVKHLIARNLNLKPIRQRVHHRDADTVQAARCLVSLAIEFAARMQRRENNFQRGLRFVFRMHVNWNAATIIINGQAAVLMQPHVDPVGVTGNRLVHGIVERFGKEVMQRLFVGSADIHAGTTAHRLKPLEHLNVLGRIALRLF